MENERCIMPEMQYCPACKYGLIIPSEDYIPGDCLPQSEKWKCLLDLFE